MFYSFSFASQGMALLLYLGQPGCLRGMHYSAAVGSEMSWLFNSKERRGSHAGLKDVDSKLWFIGFLWSLGLHSRMSLFLWCFFPVSSCARNLEPSLIVFYFLQRKACLAVSFTFKLFFWLLVQSQLKKNNKTYWVLKT